jgi:hypothetical protein
MHADYVKKTVTLYTPPMLLLTHPPLQELQDMFSLSLLLHGHVQPLFDQLMVEERHRQAPEAPGGFSNIVAVKVLPQHLPGKAARGVLM